MRRKRREHLIEDLQMRKERKQEQENRTSQSSLDEYRPLKSRGMALRFNFIARDSLDDKMKDNLIYGFKIRIREFKARTV